MEGDRKKGVDICWEFSFSVFCLIVIVILGIEIELILDDRGEN